MPVNKTLFSAMLLCIICAQAYALKPEDVLGEYWKDPLFGSAAAKQTVQVEILYKLIWPSQVSVNANQNIRFVVTNKSDSLHMLAFSREPEQVISDQDFKAAVADEVFHAKAEKTPDAHHSHIVSSVDKPRPIVLTMDRQPRVLVKPGEFKEVIIEFEADDRVFLFCVLDDHMDEGYISEIQVQGAE